VTVLDWAEPALALGREIAAAHPDLKPTEWQRSRIGSALTIESTDLVTISYVLGELTEDDRTAVVDAAASAAQAVVVIEPGTPDGYARVIDARDRLIAAGFHIAAPCPHSAACPIVPGEDWCHFAARVSRSSLHRQVKGGSLAYEDEKFSYVAATRFAPAPAASRVVRKPQIRKGQVLLDLCGTGTPAVTDAATTAPAVTSGADADGGNGPGTGPVPTLGRTIVTKRHGPLYKAARDADWGDAWPPPTGDDDRA
jgi:ribosomal protein RSM22 (predicted rRNA methylase)